MLLTGTPMQNDLHELYALLSYLHPKVFTDSAPFDDAFDLTNHKVGRPCLQLFWHAVVLWSNDPQVSCRCPASPGLARHDAQSAC